MFPPSDVRNYFPASTLWIGHEFAPLLRSGRLIFLSAIFLSAGIRQENGRQENAMTKGLITFETAH